MSITAIGFLASYFGCLFKAFSSRPIWGLFAYLIAFYAYPPARWWGQALPSLRWSFIAAICTLLAIYVKQKNVNVFKYKETKLIFLFFVFLLSQYVWAIHTGIHSIYVVLVFKYLLLIVLIQNCLKSKKDVIQFIVVNGLGALYFGYLAYSHGGGRIEGIGGPGISSSNSLGQHLAIILIVVSYLLFLNIGKKKLLVIPVILVILNTLFLTQSRGAVLALVCTGLIAMFYIPKAYKKQFIFLFLLGGIAFAILIGPQIIERFKGVQSNETGEISDSSAASRLVIIGSQIEMFKESPFLGQGHRTTLLLSPIYIPERYRTNSSKGSAGQSRRSSHNFLMALLVDHGIIGSVIYLLIIYYCLTNLFAVKKLQKAHSNVKNEDFSEYIVLLTSFCLGLCCYMIAGLFSNNKIFEVCIWLIAVIPVTKNLLNNSLQKYQDNDGLNKNDK